MQNCNNVPFLEPRQNSVLIRKKEVGEIYAQTHTHTHTSTHANRSWLWLTLSWPGWLLAVMTTTADSHTKNTAESSSSLHSSRDTGQGGILREVTDWGKVWWEGMWWYHVTMQSAFLTGPGKHSWGGRGHPVWFPPLTPPSTAASHSPNIWRSLVI